MALRKTVRRAVRRVWTVVRFEWHAFWRSRPIRQDTVIYEAFFGKGMVCNPEAIFRELLAAPDLKQLRHVWVLSDLGEYRDAVREFTGNPNVLFIKRESLAYYRWLATAKYLINNHTFPPQFSKRPGQVYVNTWHGTPLKRLGYDIAKPLSTHVGIRNFISADYLVSSNEFSTRQMYESAFRLRGIYRGRVIQEGTPRIDRQYASATEATQLRAQLRDRDVAIDDDRKVILYAPTWKGRTFSNATNDVAELADRVRQLSEQIDTDRWRVLLRVHQHVYRYAVEDPQLRNILVPNDIPANVALAVTDVLVTDYSSIFYDFLATGRPVLFYVPDLADYTDYRGLYVPPEEWPGPVTDSVAQLAEHVNNLGSGGELDIIDTYAAQYAKAAAEYCSLEDGTASSRVVDVVFRGKTEGYDIRELTDERESILVQLGTLRTNGITTSTLNLLDNIDYDRFDVSVTYPVRRRDSDWRKNESLINPRARLFPRTGGVNGSKRHTLGRRRLLSRGIDAPLVNLDLQRRVFGDEWNRVFGDAKFDYAVDFSGYHPFWAFLLLQADAKSRSIWMHNDMIGDRMRTVDGKRPFERSLGAVFSMYRLFDRLVSVSPTLAEVNRGNLGDAAGSAEFVSAVNTINVERITTMAAADVLAEFDAAAEAAREAAEQKAASAALEQADDEPSVDQRAAERAEAEQKRVERRALLQRVALPEPGVRTFVAVGRLSPEKNHARLVRAFAQVHKTHPDTRLIIVGGGPLRTDLERQIAELGMDEAIVLAGRQSNPYAIMTKADFFVQSSDYEGQPMVILEARLLGLPVVSTDFSSVRGSLPDGVGLVVPRSDEGVADGMVRLLAGEVPNPRFDHAEYNRDAVEQFYRAIRAS